MSAGQKLPSADHPITVTPTGKHVVVSRNGTVIADTTAALTLQESTYPAVQYVPLVDVDHKLLEPSSNQTHCPYKGDASYYSLRIDDELLTDVIWSYRTPYDAVAGIADHVAFYPDKVDIAID